MPRARLSSCVRFMLSLLAARLPRAKQVNYDGDAELLALVPPGAWASFDTYEVCQ